MSQLWQQPLGYFRFLVLSKLGYVNKASSKDIKEHERALLKDEHEVISDPKTMLPHPAYFPGQLGLIFLQSAEPPLLERMALSVMVLVMRTLIQVAVRVWHTRRPLASSHRGKLSGFPTAEQ
ncbi:hypothetical protein U0070_011483 [Myodes glareolus]|uniref:Uncharacterized protein n=1 Tax=Myodes glareolus TaxID=447135 RepID=A0AAW0HMC6_MYOGA